MDNEKTKKNLLNSNIIVNIRNKPIINLNKRIF